MYNTGVAVEACQTQATANSEECSDNLTCKAQLLQTIHINHDGRRNAEGAHIAERIHLLAEVTAANAESAGSTAIHRIKNYSDYDENGGKEEITLDSFKIDSTPKIRLAELMLLGIRRRQFIVL